MDAPKTGLIGVARRVYDQRMAASENPNLVVTDTAESSAACMKAREHEIFGNRADELGAVVSKHQPLVDRAEELVDRASRAVETCWEQGIHPNAVPTNWGAFNEMAALVSDLAKAIAER